MIVQRGAIAFKSECKLGVIGVTRRQRCPWRNAGEYCATSSNQPLAFPEMNGKRKDSMRQFSTVCSTVQMRQTQKAGEVLQNVVIASKRLELKPNKGGV